MSDNCQNFTVKNWWMNFFLVILNKVFTAAKEQFFSYSLKRLNSLQSESQVDMPSTNYNQYDFFIFMLSSKHII